MSKGIKYGLLKYSRTNNIGDEIQSIAAKRFLPRTDILIDRDKISLYKGPRLKMILNGWFMDEPKNWPPSNKIDPLIISFHIDPGCYKELLSKDSLEYLKKHEPIGCRDYDTWDILRNKGIKSYFSGCLTLTLKKRGLKKTDNILLVDVDEKIVSKIPKKDKKNLVNITHYNDPKTIIMIKKFIYKFKLIRNFSTLKPIKKIKRKFLAERKESSKKFEGAERLLEEYEKAKLVITPRIHVALPCLALGTPVIFIIKNRNDARFRGILDLFNSIEHEKIKEEDLRLILEKRVQNPKKYLRLRQDLEKKCGEFIGKK